MTYVWQNMLKLHKFASCYS